MVFAFYDISARLVVAGNILGRARNILAHERRFRTIIVCDLIYGACLVVVLTALYLILTPVNRGLALLAALCRPALLLSGADYLRVLEADRLQAMMRPHFGAGFD